MAGKLPNRNQERASGNAYDLKIREAALRVYQERYGDFGATFAKKCLLPHEYGR